MINFFSLIHVLVHTCAKKLYPLYGDGITHRFLLCCSGLMVQARLPAAKTELESKKEPDLEERQFLFQYLSCFERKILFFFFFRLQIVQIFHALPQRLELLIVLYLPQGPHTLGT